MALIGRSCVYLLAAISLAASASASFWHHKPWKCTPTIPYNNYCADDPSDTQTSGITPELLADFKLMSQYAAATYWPGNTNSTGTPLSCSGSSCKSVPEGNCPLVEQAMAHTIDEIQDTPRFDDHGYIALDDTNKLIVLAFRGTHSLRNWLEDFKFNKVDTPDLCKHCRIHHGFWEQWVPMRALVEPYLQQASKDHPDYRVIVTGHSLGGALAIIAATDLRKSFAGFSNIELYSFGAPRPGNGEAVKFMTKQSDKSYRITSNKDPIPRIPWTMWGYMHTSPEYEITTNANDPQPGDFRVVTGYFNSHGDDGKMFGIPRMDIHRHYFGHITGCDPHPPKDPDPKVLGDNSH